MPKKQLDLLKLIAGCPAQLRARSAVMPHAALSPQACNPTPNLCSSASARTCGAASSIPGRQRPYPPQIPIRFFLVGNCTIVVQWWIAFGEHTRVIFRECRSSARFRDMNRLNVVISCGRPRSPSGGMEVASC
jgi:hypothetical protein